jgi:murein endopeptidase
MLDSARASLPWRRVLPLLVALGAVGLVAHCSSPRLVTEVRAGTAVPQPVPQAPSSPGPASTKAEARSGLIELAPITIQPSANPLDAYSPQALDKIALSPPASLGSIVIGRPTRGRLFNAVELTSGAGIRVMTDDHNYGTASTVRFLQEAATELRQRFPHAPDVPVGDISRARGGYLRPHRSHQLGLDVDIGYFYDPPAKWYTRASAKNLDETLTWAFLKALIAQGGVEYVFMDRSVQYLLREHAQEIGEDPAWLDALFDRPHKKDTLFRHTWGHLTHYHVRFLDPAAAETGRRLEKRLRKAGKI